MAITLSDKQVQDGWQVVKFAEIAKNISKRVDPTTTDLEVYVGLEHLDPQSLRIQRRGVPSDVKGQKLQVRPGQIIFGKRRAYQKKLAVADFDGICSAHAMVLEEIPGKIIPGLLPFFMQSDMFMDRAVAISEGSLSPTIKWKTFAVQEFPLPPFGRQKEILEVLEKNEEVKVKKKTSLDSLNRLKRVLLARIFDKNRAKGKQWTFTTLKNVAQYQNGKAFPSKDYSLDGVKLLRPGNIAISGKVEWKRKSTTHLPRDYWDDSEKYRVFSNEIVMNLTAQSLDDGFLGRVCRTTEGEECLLNQRIVCITNKTIDHNYLFWALQSPMTRKYIHLAPTGTKVKHLYNKGNYSGHFFKN